MTKSNTRVKNLKSEWNQKYQHFFPNAYRSLLYIQFVAVAFQTTLKKKSFDEGPSLTNYGPALDPPLGGFDPKVNTNVRCHEYFIPTKFGKYPSSDSVVKADCVPILIHELVHPPPTFHLNK